MKKYILPLLMLSTTVFANQPASSHNMSDDSFLTKKQKEILSKAANIIDFNYSLTYLGPSLSSDYKGGATYNRIKTGQDWKGDDNDYKASNQTYQSFSLGFRLSQNLRLSYSYTFQHDLNKDVEYNSYNSDGSVYAVNKRSNGYSANNQRLNLFISNIINNNTLYFGANFYYERATTEISEATGMTYGLGIQPSIGFYTSNIKFFHGIHASFERDFYENQDFDYNCGGFTCNTKRQTFRASTGYYLGYYATEKLSLKASLNFDWDQDGDQVDQLAKFSNILNRDIDFNKNMDDIFEIGPTYRVSRQTSISAKVQAAINEADIKKTAIIGNFSLSL